jgi:hypothetical protein
MPRPGGPDALATTEQVAARARESADRLVGWLRENNVWGPEHAIVLDIAGGVEKHLPRRPDGFLLRLGPRTVKSGRATLLVARGDRLHQFELTPEHVAAVGLRERGTVFAYLPNSIDNYRARPTVDLSDLRIDGDDHVTASRPLTGTVRYRFAAPPRPGGYLRLLYYLPGYKYLVKLSHRPTVPLAAEGELAFKMSPFDTRPFRDEPVAVVFADWMTRDGTAEVCEGGGAAALIRMRFE